MVQHCPILVNQYLGLEVHFLPFKIDHKDINRYVQLVHKLNCPHNVVLMIHQPLYPPFFVTLSLCDTKLQDMLYTIMKIHNRLFTPASRSIFLESQGKTQVKSEIHRMIWQKLWSGSLPDFWKLSLIEALHVTHHTVNMTDCSNAFKKSVITTYHDSPTNLICTTY